jgi:hypothetical protein
VDDTENADALAKTERVAYHEAGHAVACIWFEIPPDVVTIVPEGESLGYVEHNFYGISGLNEDREKLEEQALIAFAGAACEALHFGKGRDVDWCDEGYRHDIVQASRILYSLAEHDNEGAAYFDWVGERAKSLVARPLFVAAVDALAEALIEHQKLAGERAHEIVQAVWNTMRPDLG